ncbi:hypothetical protein [Lacisediminimonas profundi]|uniref:hypothetical protein n=1 Tax=Lacisediminimonas profundi TaxID=2603856 RepID=UPI00124B6DBD|nr:hypothetical protein [Lacisediminimonas profundi]
MAKYEGGCSCQNCGKKADVYTDKNGLAYYKCGPCGFFPKFSNMRHSQAFLQGKVERDEPAQNTPPPEGAIPVPANTVPGPAKKKAGFFDGVLT